MGMTNAGVWAELRTEWLGRDMICHEQIDSTNLEAVRLAEEGAPDGLAVTAEYQSAGIGRRGRNWESAEGAGIFMSILLRPQIEPDRASMTTLVTAYSIASVLNEQYDLDVKIKWPNDIVLNKKKVAGILTQMQAGPEGIRHLVIGIGVNVNTNAFSPELEDKATSLLRETGQLYDRNVLTADILNRLEYDLERFYRARNLEFLKAEYEQFLMNKGDPVRIGGREEEWSGVALGINKTGELLVQRADGVLESVDSGEVSVRGLYSYV